MKNDDLTFYAQTGAKIFAIAGIYIVFGAYTYHVLEKLTWLDAFYFVVVSLGTIGYGDITPKTNSGKIFTIFFVIFGLAIFSTLITNIVVRARERREKRSRD
jgi:NADH:ubiquinone oxidoreductase subunit 6 (subunit J)